MPKFVVGDVVRVLSNEGLGTVRDVDKFIGRVGLVTETNPQWYKIGAFDEVWWFRNDEAEIAQIQVGDRVITERFVSYENGNPNFQEEGMAGLVGVAGEVIRVGVHDVHVLHPGEGYKQYYWPLTAVKFALEGDVPAAPQQAAVGAARALPKAKPKKPKVVKVRNMRSEMNKRANKDGPGTASYAIQFKDGSVRWQIRDACHARIGMSRYEDHKDKTAADVVAIATAVQPYYKRAKTLNKPGYRQQDYKRFVDYIVKRSPYADCFLPCASPIRYSVYMNLKRSVHNIAAAAIALREGSEQYAGKVSTFIWLLDQGVSEDAAWVTSRFFYPNGVDGKDGEYTFRACNAHDAITATTKAKKFFKVFKDGLYLNEVPYTKKADPYEVYACFGATDRYGEKTNLESLGHYLTKQSDLKRIGAGWNVREVILGSGVIKAAKWVEEQIKAVREGKDVPFIVEEPKKEKKPRVRKAKPVAVEAMVEGPYALAA